MPRKSDAELIADLEKEKERIQALQLTVKRKMRAVRSRQRDQTQRDRAHVGIVVGLEVIEHAIRNPASEVRRLVIRIIENHLTKRPDDPPVANLLAQLTDLAPAPATSLATPQSQSIEDAAE